MTTADDMVAMLRRHYLPDGRPPGGIFAPEIGSPDGRRRADLLWMPVTIAGGRGLHGHEVKISRADVVTELNDPTKAEPWAQYCSRWWLVVADPSLVEGLDVPDAWGIMAPPSGRRRRSMTILRPAPELHPKEPAPGVARLASWLFHRTSDQIREAEGNQAHYKRQAEQAEARAQEARVTGGQTHPAARRVGSIIHQVEKRLNDQFIWADVADDDVIEALVDVAGMRRVAASVKHDVETAIRSVEHILDPFRHTARQLEKVLKEASAG